MDRLYFVDSSVSSGEVITSFKGVRLYDGDTKVGLLLFLTDISPTINCLATFYKKCDRFYFIVIDC